MRKTLIASSISLALAAAFASPVQANSGSAANCETPIEERLVSATDDAIDRAVTESIAECTQPAPEVVSRGIKARPDQIVVIVKAGIRAAPDQLEAIVEAAVAAAPDQAELIVSAATDAMPTAAGSSADGPIPRSPGSLPSGGSGGGTGGGTTASAS